MKRWIAMLLTVCMLFSLCPVGAFAESATDGTEPAQTVQTEQGATGATKGTAAPAEGAPKENADANNAENGNAAANNGTGNAENKENATGATNEEPKAETKTCSCKDLCDMLHPNAGCEVCANSNDVGTCCKGSVAKLDAVDPQPAAEEEELVCTTCTTKCTDGHVNDSCEACKADPSKCRIVEDNQALVDTYEFYVEGIRQDAWTQSLEEGQTLNVPGNPSKDGAVFQGWYRLDGENKIPVVSGAVSDVSGKTVRVDAVFAEFSYVLFMSRDGSAVVHTVQGSSGNTVSDADLDTAAEMVNLSLGPTEAVVGWSSTLGGEAGAVAFAAGTVKVYPVITTGYWVIFDSKGGNYVAPVFAQDGQTVTLPTATRPGYTFDGWYQGEQPVTQVNAAANLEAHWIAAKNTKYTVIHWQENANDDEYSFKESEPKTGTTGEKTDAKAKSYEGFTAQTVTQQTIAGDGSTIVNVYYKRNVYTITFYLDDPYYSCGKEAHTHSDWCYLWGCGKEEHTHSTACGYVSQITITAKHGANISDQWPTVAGSNSWRTTKNGSICQSNIDVMPVGGGSYYGPRRASGSETAYYYVQVLPGETGTVTNGGISYKLHHSDTSPGKGYIVTEEDRYPITGFTYKEGNGLGSNYKNAKFYYTRNSYDIVFINNGTTEKTQSMKFEQSLSGVSYEPTRPAGVPAGYVFDGWYENEVCEGSPFVFDGKTMPAQNITLYAKWVAPEVTATVYLTVTVGGESRTLSVPYGSSLVEAPGYAELMQEITAKNNGSAPSAWFSVDANGAKTLFNPDTKLYAPVTLVPHFSGTLETFTVIYEEGDQAGPSDGNLYQSGSYATVLGPINGNLRFLYWRDKAHNKIYKPGESMKMSGNVILTAEYTEAPATVGLTYHSGEVSSTETGIRSNTFTTVKSAADLGFTAPTGYVFAGWSTTEGGAATYFPRNAVYVPEKGADLYAVWTKRTDLSYTVQYLEKGTGENVKDPVVYTGQTFSSKISVAQYREDITGYTWVSTTPEDTLTIGVGSNVITLYYKRNTHQVSYSYTGTVPTGAPEAHEASEEAYGATVTVAPAPTLDGYVFSGWTAENVTVDANGFFTMPNHDVTFTGSWSARSDLSYTVVYKWNNQVIDTVEHPGQTFGDEVIVTPTAPQNYTLKRDESKHITIAADESANVVVFELYKNVTLQANSDSVTYDGKLKSVDGYTANDLAAEFEGITAHGEGTNAGRYDVTFNESPVGKKSVDDNYIVVGSANGLLIINKADTAVVKITGHHDTKTYNGSEQHVEGYDIDKPADVTVKLKEGKSAVAKGTNVGTYQMNLKAEDFEAASENYKEVRIEVTDGYLVIEQADVAVVKITGHHDTKTYNGSEQHVEGYDIDKPADVTVKLKEGKSAVAKGTNVGTYQMGLKAEDFEAASENYKEVKIEVTDGYLVIDPTEVEITVVIKGNTNTVTYAGIEQTVSGYTVESIDNTLYAATDFIYTGTAEASGIDVGSYTMGLKAEDFKNTNGNFENVVFEIVEDGKLTITPAPLTVTTDSANKVYDGTALTAPGSITGLVNDETVTFTVTGSQTDVGSSTNTYSIVWGNVKAANYSLTEELGTLTVTAQSITPPVNPDDPNGYLGVQVDSPADHVYDGAEHKWAPTVTDKDGNALTENEDYTVTYDKTDFTNVTGDITVTIQGIGNYTGTVTRSYKITPKTVTITVNNGRKTVGQNDPAFTGTVEGLVDADDLGTVTYVRTNNAEAVGTYTDVLTAQYTENANYEVLVINGDFTIAAANNPGPGPEPKPEPEPEPEPKPEPQPEPEGTVVEEIVDEPTPLAMGGAWALVNLILTILTVLGSILLLIGYIGKKQKEREDENGNVILNAEGEAETDDIKKKGGWRLASIIPAVAAVIAFILTENMRLPMVLVDKWTLLMVIIALVQLLVAYFSKKKTQEPEQPEQMVANA